MERVVFYNVEAALAFQAIFRKGSKSITGRNYATNASIQRYVLTTVCTVYNSTGCPQLKTMAQSVGAFPKTLF